MHFKPIFKEYSYFGSNPQESPVQLYLMAEFIELRIIKDVRDRKDLFKLEKVTDDIHDARVLLKMLDDYYVIKTPGIVYENDEDIYKIFEYSTDDNQLIIRYGNIDLDGDVFIKNEVGTALIVNKGGEDVLNARLMLYNLEVINGKVDKVLVISNRSK